MRDIYRLRLVDRLRGIGPRALVRRSVLAGGVPSSEMPPTARRIRLGHAAVSRHNALSGLASVYAGSPSECAGQRDCCVGGKFFYNGQEQFTRGNWMAAVSTCGRARGAAHDLAKMQLVMKAKAYYERDPSSISSRIYQAVIDCANKAKCPGAGQLNINERATQDALAHRDAVNQAITENRALTAAEQSVTEYADGPGSGYQVVTPTLYSNGGGNGNGGSSGGGGSVVFQTGGGVPPVAASAIADILPDVLKSDSGEPNWLLLAAIAGGIYFMAQKK